MDRKDPTNLNRRLRLLLAVAGVCCLAQGGVAADAPANPQERPPEVRSLGAGKQLLIDDEVIASMQNLKRTLHPGTKHPNNPVFKPEKPWEGAIQLYGSVLLEPDGTYRMWYNAIGDSRPGRFQGERLCLATSKDGIHWDRPKLRLVADIGWRSTEPGDPLDNNILIERAEIPSVFRDDRDPDPSRRYKMYLLCRGGLEGKSPGFYLLYSPDGITWKPCATNPVHVGDDVCTFVQDARTGEYLGFPKTQRPVDGHYRRQVGLIVSRDGLQWSPLEPILLNDEQDDRLAQANGYTYRDFYGMSGFSYEGMYLGFVWTFSIWAGREGGLPNEDGTIELELAFSHDGKVWSRYPTREPVLARTPCASIRPCVPVRGKAPEPYDGKPRPFDAGMIFTATQPVIAGDEIRLYYCGIDSTHLLALPEYAKKMQYPPPYGAVGLATWRLDGFVSLDAGAQEGMLLTKPLSFEGNQLEINAEAAGGSVCVELLGADGKALAGFGASDCVPLKGDGVHQMVTWRKGSVGALAGRPVQLRFLLRNAKLYSFKFKS